MHASRELPDRLGNQKKSVSLCEKLIKRNRTQTVINFFPSFIIRKSERPAELQLSLSFSIFAYYCKEPRRETFSSSHSIQNEKLIHSSRSQIKSQMFMLTFMLLKED